MAYGVLRALFDGAIAPGEEDLSAMTRFLAPLLALCVLIGAAWGFAALQPCSAPAQKARALGLPVGATSCPAPIRN